MLSCGGRTSAAVGFDSVATSEFDVRFHAVDAPRLMRIKRVERLAPVGDIRLKQADAAKQWIEEAYATQDVGDKRKRGVGESGLRRERQPADMRFGPIRDRREAGAGVAQGAEPALAISKGCVESEAGKNEERSHDKQLRLALEGPERAERRTDTASGAAGFGNIADHGFVICDGVARETKA